MKSPRGPVRPALRRGIGLCIILAALASLGMAALALGGGGPSSQAITLTVAGGGPTLSGADGLRAGFTQITLRNTGRAPGLAAIARLRPGVTIPQLRRVSARSQNVPSDLITLPTSAFLAPGERQRSTVRLGPGDYLALQPPQGPGLGRFVRFSVGREQGDRTPPRAAAEITMFDHGLLVPQGRFPGRGTLAIRNIGQNFHFIAGIRLNPGANARQVARILRSPNGDFGGPPPGEFVSIMGIAGPGTTNYVETDLRPGRYVIACFFSDRSSAGRGHNEFGMVRIVTVT